MEVDHVIEFAQLVACIMLLAWEARYSRCTGGGF
jgi:hypothetical protein